MPYDLKLVPSERQRSLLPRSGFWLGGKGLNLHLLHQQCSVLAFRLPPSVSWRPQVVPSPYVTDPPLKQNLQTFWGSISLIPR